MSWRQVLHSVLSRDPQGRMADDFYIVTQETGSDYERMKPAISERIKSKYINFISNHGDKIPIGIGAETRDVLGEHEYSYTQKGEHPNQIRGRQNSFVHSYFAPAGTPVPDLAALKAQQRVHLEKILDLAHAGKEPVEIKDATFPPGRTPSADPNSWDRIAAAMERGEHRGKYAIFDKDGRFLSMISPARDSTEDVLMRAASASAQKKTPGSFPAQLERMGFLKVTAVGLAVAVAVYLGWRALEHRRKTESHQDQGVMAR